MARIMLFNGKDWEPLDWDVRAQDGTLSWGLNRSAMIELTIPVQYNRHKYKKFPRIYKNMTHVVVEDDNGLLLAGIAKDTPESLVLDVVAHGHSVLSKDYPWRSSEKSWIDADGVKVFREVWQHIIKTAEIPRLELRGATSGGSRVGEPASPAYERMTQQIEAAEKFVTKRDNRVETWERQLERRAKEMFAASGRKSVGEVVLATDPPETKDAGTHKAVIEQDRDQNNKIVAVHFWNWTGVGAGHWAARGKKEIIDAAKKWVATNGSLGRAKELYPTYVTRAEELTKQRDELYGYGEPEPYEVNWWEARDLSSNLEEIRELGDFDWYDSARWVDGEIRPGITILSKDRAIREDIHLELGVNVEIDVDVIPGDSASHIAVLGQGEGDSTLRSERRIDHDRLVPVYKTVSDKDLRTKQLVDKAADKERKKAQKAIDESVAEFTIWDHPLAPLSSFVPGDRVRVVGTLASGSDFSTVIKISEIKRDLGGKVLGVSVEQ